MYMCWMNAVCPKNQCKDNTLDCYAASVFQLGQQLLEWQPPRMAPNASGMHILTAAFGLDIVNAVGYVRVLYNAPPSVKESTIQEKVPQGFDVHTNIVAITICSHGNWSLQFHHFSMRMWNALLSR